MATLPGQRATFTWALREYNKTEDPDQRAKFAKNMANALDKALELGVSKEAKHTPMRSTIT
jgi:hypothetical protein